MLRCQKCGREYPNKFRLRCECGGVLDVLFSPFENFYEEIQGNYMDIRRYLNFLPISEEFLPGIVLPVTPIVHHRIRGIDVFFKLEYLMPSGSFKDRGTFVTLAKLMEEGIKDVTLDSSGNAALSLSLFGRCEGMNIHIFIPSYTSEGKKKLLRKLGVMLHEIEGDRMLTHRIAEEFQEGTYVSHWYNPFFIEGTKTVAYEVMEQIGEVDYVIAPVGSGSLFVGLFKGFRELRDMLHIRIPRMIAAQAKGYESLCKRSKEKSRLAEGIFIPEPPRLEQMKEILNVTHGVCHSSGDSEIKNALDWLFSHGFLVEPTSAVAFSTFISLLNEEIFQSGERVLIPLTGSGLKLL